jgi:protein NrfD
MAATSKTIAWAIWVIAAAIGLHGMWLRFTTGHLAAGYTSYVPWGLWVAGYIYFIGLSAGAFLLSSLVYVFGVRRLELIARLTLATAAITLALALITIWFDLGHAGRFWETFTRPQFHSMMAWMVWLYTAYLIVILAELYYALRNELSTSQRRRLAILGALGVPLAVAFHGGVGALFATVGARPVWHTAIYPIIFLNGALLSGGALITAIVAWLWPRRDAQWRNALHLLGKIVLGLLAFDVVLEIAEYLVPMWYGIGSEYHLLRYVLLGPQWYVFWLIHVALGILIPGLILWRGRSAASIGGAAAMIALTYLAVRIELVVPGLVRSPLPGLAQAYQSARLSFHYSPTFFEWEILIGVVALGVGLFYVLWKLLPLVPMGPASEARS